MRLQLSKEIQWLLEEKYHGRLTSSVSIRGISRRETEGDIIRLQKGEHVDYVIGFVDFLGCKIDLSKRPFIPRPETEYWTQKAIEDMQRRDCPPLGGTVPPKLRVLDIFAGSGCVGVAVLKHVPQAHVDFGEKQKRLFSQIRLNAEKNRIDKKRYRVIQSDVFSSIKDKYDYIFANPPYVAESRKNRVQSSVLKHEPREALFAGTDGLSIIRKFLRQAKDFLAPGGKIYMEFDSFQKHPIEQYLKKLGYQSWEFFKDQYGKWRYLKIVYNKEDGSRARTTKSGAGRGRRLKRGSVARQP